MCCDARSITFLLAFYTCIVVCKKMASVTIGARAIYPGGARAPPLSRVGGQEGHRVRAPVNAQRYKLIALFA